MAGDWNNGPEPTPAPLGEMQWADEAAGRLPASAARHAFDVDDNGAVTPADVLTLVNYLNAPAPAARAAAELDVNWDGRVTPMDVLLVINYVNAVSAAEARPAMLAQGAPDDLPLASAVSTWPGPAAAAGIVAAAPGDAAGVASGEASVPAWPAAAARVETHGAEVGAGRRGEAARDAALSDWDPTLFELEDVLPEILSKRDSDSQEIDGRR